MESLYYDLAEFHMRIESPFPIVVTSESKAFISMDAEAIQERVVFEAVKELPEMPPEGVWHENRYFVKNENGEGVYLRGMPMGDPYAMIRYEEDHVWCDYVKNSPYMVGETLHLLNMLGLEKILLRNRTLILHASFVSWQGDGILFCAPSGTGKSTQAELWSHLMKAEIINGDRAGIRQTDGIWRAYGLPYAGSSKIYRNDSAPIRAIVVLEKSHKNEIEKIGPAEGMRYLIPETSIRRWQASDMEEALDLLKEIVTQVPVYLLRCRPDAGAVGELYKAIRKEEEK